MRQTTITQLVSHFLEQFHYPDTFRRLKAVFQCLGGSEHSILQNTAEILLDQAILTLTTCRSWASLLLRLQHPHSSAFLAKSPLVVERADPVVSLGKVSAHVHTIMGGNGFGFQMDYASNQASTCSSCTVDQDKSNYWVPVNKLLS
jgi:hypothetical protein